MIMSSERGSLFLLKSAKASLPAFLFTRFLLIILVLHRVRSVSPPQPVPSSLSFIVLRGPRTNHQKGHFHLWTAGFNRYLFHAFKINPILLLSVWFVYFAWNIPSLEWGGVGEGATGCNSPWTSIILDFSTGWSSMQKRHFLSTKIKTIMMIKKTCVLFVLV